MSEDTIRILLVEDDPIDRIALERRVRQDELPYDLHIVTSESEALDVLRTEVFDVVLLDYNLGGGSGFEVLSHVGDSPAIFITGSGSEEIAAQAMREGAYDYLIKDIDRHYLKVLPSTIRNVLARRRLEQEKDRLIVELKQALEEVKTLQGIIPICAGCKKVRNDEGYWEQVEVYIHAHSGAQFTHGICPVCYDRQLNEVKKL